MEEELDRLEDSMETIMDLLDNKEARISVSAEDFRLLEIQMLAMQTYAATLKCRIERAKNR